jgi:hypothetical protein
MFNMHSCDPIQFYSYLAHPTAMYLKHKLFNINFSTNESVILSKEFAFLQDSFVMVTKVEVLEDRAS